jgi:hypothetical protein
VGVSVRGWGWEGAWKERGRDCQGFVRQLLWRPLLHHLLQLLLLPREELCPA